MFECGLSFVIPRESRAEIDIHVNYRLDDDQCARKNAQRFFDVVDPDYYEFEGKDSMPLLLSGANFIHLSTKFNNKHMFNKSSKKECNI